MATRQLAHLLRLSSRRPVVNAVVAAGRPRLPEGQAVRLSTTTTAAAATSLLSTSSSSSQSGRRNDVLALSAAMAVIAAATTAAAATVTTTSSSAATGDAGGGAIGGTNTSGPHLQLHPDDDRSPWLSWWSDAAQRTSFLLSSSKSSYQQPNHYQQTMCEVQSLPAPQQPFDHSALFRVKAALEARTEAQKVRLAQIVHDLQEMAKETSSSASNVSETTRDGGSPHRPNRLRRCVTMVMSGLSHRSTKELQEEHAHFDKEGHISLKGINLLGLTHEHAMEIIDLLRSGGQLDKRSMLALIAAAKIVLRCDPTLIDLRGRAQRVTVVGDLHGSMACLNNVLQLSPFGEGTGRVIVFDGDFVDRGEESVEVLATLLLLKLANPQHVILLRGNHEDTLIASVYGFQDEVRLKYGVNTAHDLWDALGSLFAMLPIAARTETSLILHGGIPSESFDLDRLVNMSAQDRSMIRTVVKPESDDEEFLADILWSDPSDDHLGIIENPRGHGKSFGTNVARNFLDKHNIKYLIRGHEPVEGGLDEMKVGHGHCVLTVFSNASYPNGEGTNLGAVVHLDTKGDYRYDTFSYSDACTKIKQTSQTITEETISTLRSMIASRRSKLQTAFRGLEKDGRIDASDWAEIMSTELDLPGMPWRLLLSTLAPSVDKDNQLDWRAFLQRNSLPWMDAKGLDDQQVEQLHDQHEMLLTVFKFLDVDGKGKGTVGPEDFKTGFELLNRRLPRREHLKNPDAVFRALDRDNKGYIKVEDFGTLFRVA